MLLQPYLNFAGDCREAFETELIITAESSALMDR